jgi:hypothetical protein
MAQPTNALLRAIPSIKSTSPKALTAGESCEWVNRYSTPSSLPLYGKIAWIARNVARLFGERWLGRSGQLAGVGFTGIRLGNLQFESAKI